MTNRDEVRRRLLLCLYGAGTNAGLKRLAVGDHGFSYKELLHTHRRYIDAESIRDATRRVPAGSTTVSIATSHTTSNSMPKLYPPLNEPAPFAKLLGLEAKYIAIGCMAKLHSFAVMGPYRMGT